MWSIRKIIAGYLFIILFGFFPLIIAFTAYLIGNCANCTINEAGVHDCIFFGKNHGETLYSMFVFGWFSIITIPIGIILFTVWTVYVTILLIAKQKNKKKEKKP